jgi:hypothetical protein
MPGPNGIIIVKGSFELSDLCDKEFHKMAQNFGMMASYREPNFLYIALPFYYYSPCLHYCILLSFYHLIRSILCSQQTDEIDNLIKVGSKVLGCIVCRFHIAAGEKLHADKQLIWCSCLECHKASKHHLLKFGFLLLVRLNLGFITEGNLLLCSTKPSSWGSQLGALTSHHQGCDLPITPQTF